MRYNFIMDAAIKQTRLPRFRRASQPPAFRLTDDDVAIIRHIAMYRFLRSTHIAELVSRSLDRTNDRLCRLYHAGYIDRPRAQLDYYPTAGSAPIVYALADRGARLIAERDGNSLAHLDWSRKNREAGRPFIEHQLEIIDFRLALQRASDARRDIEIIQASELAATMPAAVRAMRDPFAMHVRVSVDGIMHDVGLVPDFAFAVRFNDGSRRCFLVEIDRGTMPVVRSNISQTSILRKMRAYLSAHAARLHERQFGWKAFRVLVVTTDRPRVLAMIAAGRQIAVSNPYSCSLFLFTSRMEYVSRGLFDANWMDGLGRPMSLI